VGELLNSRLPSLEPDSFAMLLPRGLQLHGDTLATVIRAPAGHALHSLGPEVLRDSTLFALSMDGIRVYRLHRE
jgi:hypothetical protein